MENISRNVLTALILLPVIILTKLVEALPWWVFVVPVFALGVFIANRKWNVSCFAVGFLTGFIIWLGANIFFHFLYDGILLGRIGPAPSIAVLLFSGVVGGSLTGLALYTGKVVATNKKVSLTL